ncbi:helix-turn-helix transcriptional regulator [Streptomyces sp. NL15-2K]|uniref:helix-turn-helix domain-containing protein n=1 Tax=Streptomyces sp. NL15-2K TaxID=376149 RepID=UPI000FFA11D6|nr:MULTISPECIES: helix-turn-helix transcriptional regulator [Actinomycetes]WKX14708.1 helix-turn-helix transcriptional regulator [Kutzneria buriramensis]GCB44147.1 hypothetical protein SNL152K_1432 [Streptomyces sp. NL15-2K]
MVDQHRLPGGAPFPEHAAVAPTLAAGACVSPLTAREYDVLRLVAAGHTNLEIGAELNLSVNTVKTYLREVMRKLGTRNRAQS